MKWFSVFVGLGVLVLSAAAPVRAGDAAAGLARAKQACAECHVIATGVGGGGTDGAPTFSSIANELKLGETRIKTFLSRPHGRMPDFVLTRIEIDDLTAYILSLRKR